MAAETTYMMDVGTVIRHGVITEHDAIIIGFKDRQAALAMLNQLGQILARDKFQRSLICVAGIIYKYGQHETRYGDSETRPDWLSELETK